MIKRTMAMIFSGQENQESVSEAKERYMYVSIKRNRKIPVKLLKLRRKRGFWLASFFMVL